ncbi:MAG: hypothetical protein J6Q63_07590 [Bacteroidales bacterium]|nr:hypothetical protein [Bacteroidales bacterium]MBO5943131.1 hypothetical protein [Bacteroidales bacterium]
MKKSRMIRAITSVVASMFLLLTSSCVNKEYELSEDRISLDVTVFQDGLSVPLGSTSKIMLKDVKDSLLKNVEDTSMLKYFTVGFEGEYGIGLSDKLDLSDTLNNLLAQIEIPDVPFSEKFSFNLNTVDVSSLTVPADRYEFTESIGGSFPIPEMTFDGFGTEFSASAGLYEYRLSDEFLKVKFDKFEHEEVFARLSTTLPEVPENDFEIHVDPSGDLTALPLTIQDGFGPEECQMSLYMSMPDGITAIKDINLREGAKVKISVELRNSLFTKGTISPSLVLDVSKIFNLSDNSSNGKILADFDIPAAGGKVSKEFEIESLALTENDWKDDNGRLVLDKDIAVVVGGSLEYSEVYTTTKHLANTDGEGMSMYMSIEFVDFQVADAKVEIKPISVEMPQETISFSQSIDLPDQIQSIDEVVLTEDSKITMSIDVENMLEGLNLKLTSLDVTFPDGLKVEGAVNGVLSYSDVDLSKGFDEDIKILGVTLPDPENGSILLEKEIGVEAVVTAGGLVSSADIPVDASKDLKVNVDVKAAIAVADYAVTITGYDYELDFSQSLEPIDVTGIEEFGTVTVMPKGEPVISIDVIMPETDLQIVADREENVVISFPEMLKFKDLPSEYNYDKAAGTITFAGQIPSRIELPIDRLVINPEKNEEDGKYYIGGDFKVSGGIGIPAGSVVRKADVEAITSPECKIGMVADIPEIAMGTLAMDAPYEKAVKQEFEVALMSMESIPEELVSIDCVEFEDVFFNLCLDASELPDLGSTKLALEFEIGLPDLIVIDSENVKEGNVLTVSGELDKDGKITIDPIRVAALDLSSIDFKSTEELKEVITVDGKVILDNVALDINEWLGKTLEVRVEGGIKDIEISKVSGKVDFQIDPIATAVDLTEVKEYLEMENLEINGIENFLARLSLAADIKTNVGVPMGARMVITPYSEGNPIEEAVWETELTLNHSLSAADTTYTRYWLSSLEKDKDVYVPTGYTHIHLPLKEYLSNIPDSLSISIEAGTDPSAVCVIEPTHEYVVEAAYSVEVPFEFGEGCSVTYRDTIPDLPPLVGQLLAMGDLVLTGDITSSLPLEIDMKVNLLDMDGNKISLDESASWQKIKGCTPDGEPAITELYLGIQKQDGVEVNGVSAIELEFNFATVAGVPLSDNCFLQASLQALVPNGVSVDLNELMTKKEE